MGSLPHFILGRWALLTPLPLVRSDPPALPAEDALHHPRDDTGHADAELVGVLHEEAERRSGFSWMLPMLSTFFRVSFRTAL